MKKCIYKKNPASGFEADHKLRCGCGEPATHHVYMDFWCGFVCKQCADRQQKRGAWVVVTAIKSSDLPALSLEEM